MKKVVFSIIFILMLLTIANVAYADYGIPGTVQYEAIVTNENGAEISENSYSKSTLSVIPYGATVTVSYEIRWRIICNI